MLANGFLINCQIDAEGPAAACITVRRTLLADEPNTYTLGQADIGLTAAGSGLRHAMSISEHDLFGSAKLHITAQGLGCAAPRGMTPTSRI